MHFITGTHIPRRTFLRGAGATVALPFLDAMIPAGGVWSRRGAAEPPARLVAIEMVHGAAGCNEWGATQHLWAPSATGRNFDLSPGSLLPLEPYRDRLSIISNTDVRMAEAREPHEIGGDHFRSSAVFLTQAHPKQTRGSDVFAGTSMDQLHAQRFGQDTPVPSMQLCIENVDQSGGCAYGYSCVYTDTISWASSSEPLPMIRDPRVAFEMLFGAGGTAEERAARRRTDGSILDWIAGEVAYLRRALAQDDRQRLDRYLENVRELERRIEGIESRNSSGEPRELPEAPAGVPDSFTEHMQLMFDIQVLGPSRRMSRACFPSRRAGTRRRGSTHRERHRQGLPSRLPSRRQRGGDPGVRKDQHLPGGTAPVSPRQAGGNDGRRRQPARQDDDHLRFAHGGRKPAQPSPLPADRAGRRERAPRGRAASEGPRRYPPWPM